MSGLNIFLNALNSNDPSIIDDRKESNRKRIIDGLQNPCRLKSTRRFLLDIQKQFEKDSQRLIQYFKAREQALTEREQALTEREQALTEHEQALTEREQALTECEQTLTEREQDLNTRTEVSKTVKIIENTLEGIFN